MDNGEEVSKPVSPPDIVSNRTSISLALSHSDSDPRNECSYCHGERNTFDGP